MSRAYVDGKFPNSQDESSHPSVLLILTEVQDLVSGAMVAKRVILEHVEEANRNIGPTTLKAFRGSFHTDPQKV